MTKLEIIKEHKRQYAEWEVKAETLVGLERLVAKQMILRWIKGNKWMGGLSDSVAQKAYESLMAMGYTFEEIDSTFTKQMKEVM